MGLFFRKYNFKFFSILFLVFILSSCRSKGAYNPYVEDKVKRDKREVKENKRIVAKGNKAYKKQLRSNRKHLFGRKTAP